MSSVNKNYCVKHSVSSVRQLGNEGVSSVPIHSTMGNIKNLFSSSSAACNYPQTLQNAAKAKSQPIQTQIYNPRADGACLFRAYLALSNNDASWLTEQSLSHFYCWVNENKDIFIGAINGAIANIREMYLSNGLQPPDEVIALDNARNLHLAEHLLNAMQMPQEFALWRTDVVSRFLQTFTGLAFSAELVDNFTNTYYAALVALFDMPVDERLPTHIHRVGNEHKGYHFVLVSDEPIFNSHSESGNNIGLYTDKAEQSTQQNAELCQEYIYACNAKDGTEFLRAYLASMLNDSAWLEDKSTQDIYRWMAENSEGFHNAIKEAATKLIAFSEISAGLKITSLFLPAEFLAQMQTKQKLNLFDPAAIKAFAESHHFLLDEQDVNDFVKNLSSRIKNNLGIKEDDNGFLHSSDHRYFRANKEGNGFIVIARDQPLAGKSFFVTRQSTFPVYEKYVLPDGLAHFKSPYVKKEESLIRNLLTLVLDSEAHLTSSYEETARALSKSRYFKRALTDLLQQALNETTAKTFSTKECKKLIDIFTNTQIAQGEFELAKALPKIVADSQNFLQDHGYQNLAQFSQDIKNIDVFITAPLLNKLGFKLVNEADLTAEKGLPSYEFFVQNQDGGLSFVSIDNFFKPSCAPRDEKIYEEDLKNYPDRANLGAHFTNSYGKQEANEKKARHPRDKNNRNNWGENANWRRSAGRKSYFADKMWNEALSKEKQTQKGSATRPHVDPNEAKVRDALFARTDAIEAGASLLLNLSENFNSSGEYLGFNTKPHVPRRQERIDYELQVTADAEIKSAPEGVNPPHDLTRTSTTKEFARIPIVKPEDFVNLPTEKRDALEEEDEAIVEDEDDFQNPASEEVERWDFFRFPEADARPLPTAASDNNQLTPEEYEALITPKQEQDKPHIRRKRRIKVDPKATPDVFMGLNFDQLDSNIKPAELAELKRLMTTDLTAYQQANPSSAAWERQSAFFEEIIEASNKNSAVKLAFFDTLDAIQLAFIERNTEFRDAYRFYTLKNEQSIKEKGSFYYHQDLENLMTKEPGKETVPFQSMTKNRMELDLMRLELLAEVLHKQSIGEHIDHKALGMTFAHIDINGRSMYAQDRIDDWSKFSAEWMKFQTEPAATKLQSKLMAKLDAIKLPGQLASPLQMDQASLYARTADSASYNAGFCHYFATSSLLLMQDQDVYSLHELGRMSSGLKKLLIDDPIAAYRIVNGMDRANWLLNKESLNIGTQSWTQFDFYTFYNSYQKLIDTMYSSQHGFNLFMRSNAGQHGKHTISVAKVKLGSQYIPVVIDANLGEIPCYTKAQFDYVLRKSIELMGHDPNDTHLTKVTFEAMETTPFNLHVLKSLETPEGFRYGMLKPSEIDRLSTAHFTTENDDWNKYFAGLTTTKANEPILESFEKYNRRTGIKHGELDVLFAKARSNHKQIAIANFAVDAVDFEAAVRALMVKNDPLAYLNLDIETVFSKGYEKNSVFKALAKIIQQPLVDNSHGAKVQKLTEVVSAVSELRASGGSVRIFLDKMLDLYMARVLDTEPTAGEAFAYFHQRTYEEVTQNSRIYKDTDLVHFYLQDLGVQYNDPELGISTRTDHMVAKILIAQAEGISLNPRELGLAWGEIAVHRQVLDQRLNQPFQQILLQSNQNTIQQPENLRIVQSIESFFLKDDAFRRQLDKYPALKALFSKQEALLTLEEKTQKQKAKKALGIDFAPLDLGMNKLLSDSSPVTKNGRAGLHFLAMSTALALSQNEAQAGAQPNIASYKKVLDRLETLRDFAANDPVKAARLTNGLSDLHNDLYAQISKKFEQLETRIHVATFEKKLQDSSLPFMVNIELENGLSHSVSISPIFIPDLANPQMLHKTYLLFDGTLGAIPCTTSADAVEALILSANRHAGKEVGNRSFIGIELYAVEVDNNVRALMEYKVTSEVDASGKSFERFQGPYSRLKHPEYPAFHEKISYNSVFAEDNFSWSKFASTHESTLSESWRTLLPEDFDNKKIQSVENINDLRGTSGGNVFLEQLERAAKNQGCGQGSCQLELDKYRSSNHQISDSSLQDGSVWQALEKQLTQAESAEIKASDAANYPRVSDIGEQKPLRNTAGDELPAVDLSKEPIPTAKQGNAVHRQPASSSASLLDIAQEAATKINADNFEIIVNQQRNDLADAVAKDKYDLDAKNSAKATTSTASQDGATVEFRADQSQMRVRVNAAATALDVAALASQPSDGASVRTTGSTTDIRRTESQSGGSHESLGIRQRDTEINFGAASRLQFSDDAATRRTQAQQLGKALLEKAKQKQGIAANQNTSPKLIAPIEVNLETAGSQVENVVASTQKMTESQAAETILSRLASAEDPLLMRQLATDMEKLQMEIHNMKMLSIDLAELVDLELTKKGLNPLDWEAIPPRHDSTLEDLYFVYRGAGEVDEQVIKIKIADEIKAELQSTKNKIQAITESQVFSKRLSESGSLFETVGYEKLGQSMQLMGKIMNLLNVYQLLTQGQNLRNLNDTHRVAFILNAMDTTGDFIANLAGVVNKLYKLLNDGMANFALQAMSRSLNDISTIIGAAASIGSTVAAIHSLLEAKTEFEYQIAVTNLSFSAVSLTLTSVAIAFPPAAPIVATIGMALSFIQALVIHFQTEAELHRRGQLSVDARLEATEKLLEIIQAIASADMENVTIQEENGVTSIILQTQIESRRIQIREGKITMFHGANSYSASLLNNDKFVFQERKGKQRNSTVFEFCNPQRGESECDIRVVKDDIKAMLKKSHANFEHGEFSVKKRYMMPNPQNYDFYKSKVYTTKELRNDAVIPCLFFDAFGPDLQEKLAKFLKHEVDFNPAGKTKTIVFNQIFPKLNLRSDMGVYPEDEHQRGKWTTHPHVRAIQTNFCLPKYQTYKQVLKNTYQTAKQEQPAFKDKDLPIETPNIDWTSKYQVDLAAAVIDRHGNWSSERAQLDGENYFLINRQYPFTRPEWIGRNRYETEDIGVHAEAARQYGFSGPERQYVTTAIREVILEQQDIQITDIDLDATELLQLILMPDKFSTEILGRTMFYLTLEDKNTGEKSTLRIHPDTYKNITRFKKYGIALTANQPVDMVIGLASRTHIIEQDNEERKRVGSYNFRFVPTYTKRQRDTVISELTKQIKKVHDEIYYRNNYLPTIWERDLARANNVIETFANTPKHKAGKSRPFYEQALKDKEKLEKEIAENWAKLPILDQQKEDLMAMQLGYSNKPHADAEVLKLKIKVTHKDGKNTLELAFNPIEHKWKSALDGFPQAWMKVEDIQRPVTITHPEKITLDGQSIIINCVFSLTIKEDGCFTFVFSHIQSTSADNMQLLQKAGNLEKLFAQLKSNNPQLSTPPDNFIVLDVSLNDKNGELIGILTKNKSTKISETRDLSKLSQDEHVIAAPADYQGHVMVYGANSASPEMVNVFYKKTLPTETIAMLQGLQFLGAEPIVDKNQAPAEYHVLYDSLPVEQRKVYYLFSPNSNMLVFQYMNAAIRESDIAICAPNELLRKVSVTGKGYVTDNIYTCMQSDRLDLLSEIAECKKNDTKCTDFISFLDEKQKLSQLNLLVFANAFYQPEQQKKALLMEFYGGENSSMLISSKEENMAVIARNAKAGYAVLGKKVQSLPKIQTRIDLINSRRAPYNLPPLFEINVSWVELIKGNALNELGQSLLRDDISTNGVPEEFVKPSTLLSQNLHIISVQEVEEGFVFGTTDGVMFFVSADFKERHLLNVDEYYFSDRNIDISDLSQVTTAYRELVRRFEQPLAPYIKLVSASSHDNKFVLIMDVKNERPFYISNNDVSEKINLVASLEMNGHPFQLTLLDPKYQTLKTIEQPLSPSNTKQTNSVEYYYYAPTESAGLVLGLKASENHNVEELPYLSAQNLYLQPQKANRKGEFSRLKIPKLQAEQTRLITLLPENTVQSSKSVQKIDLVSDKTQQPTAFIRTHVRQDYSKSTTNPDEIVTEELFIAVPKQRVDEEKSALYFSQKDLTGITQTHVLIRLFDPFDEKQNLKPCFNESISINGQPLTLVELNELISKAHHLPDPDYPDRHRTVKKNRLEES